MRTFARILAPTLALALLAAGCGGGDDETSGEAESSPEASETTGAPPRGDADLVIWTDNLKLPGVKDVADSFAEAQGITVAVQAVTDLQANFVTANGANNGPDVVVGAHDWIGNLVQNGAIDPLQLTPEQLQGYSQKAVQAVTYDNNLYGVPYGIEAVALYRNTDLAPDEAATLDDAFAAGQAAVKKDPNKVKVAFALPVGDIGDAYHMEPLYTSMGGYIFGTNPDGTYNPDDLGVGKPGSIAAAKKIGSLGEKGSKILTRSVSTDNNISLFTDGTAAFLVSGPWALPNVRDSGVKYAIQPMPGFKGEKPAVPFMGAQSFMVASNGKNKAFAQEFVSTGVNSEESMKVLQEKTGLPPAMTSVAQGLDDKDVALFTDAANKGAPMPAIPQMQAVFEPLGKAYAAIVGGADPTKTMTDTGKTIANAIG
jgi:arabinogalactan oligomer/maltooligosaccharide transport system substrate-binding protein